MSEFPQEELLSAYLDDELSPQRRADVEKLLAEDASAKAMLDELRDVSSAVKGLSAFKLDEDLGSRVLNIAERRMLADTPTDTTAPKPLAVQSAEPSAEPFWRIVGRRFLTPRAIVWSTTAVAIAILFAVYTPEEEKLGPNRPIAMEMKVANSEPVDSVVADGVVAADESIAKSRAKRGSGEFRAAPPEMKESAAVVAKKGSMKAAPVKIAEKPAMKQPDATRHLAAKGAPIETNRKAMPGKGGAGGMMGGMGMGGGMGGETSLADKEDLSRPKSKAGYVASSAKAPSAKAKSAKKTKAGEGAFSYKTKPPTITVNCYYVSSQPAAQKALKKILLSQKPPSDKKPAEDKQRSLARQQKAEFESEPISIEATPKQLERVLAEIRKQPGVFRDCSVDADSRRLAFGSKPMQQRAWPSQKLNAPPRTPSAADESTNYRVVFVLKSAKSQPSTAPAKPSPVK